VKRILLRYWQMLGGAFGLTLGGRLAFTIVGVVGLIGVVLDPLTNGAQGSNEGGVLFGFVVFVLVVVVAADATFRLLRSGAARFLARKTVG